MKKLFLLVSLLLVASSFALTDTDRDGVEDEKDTCPRVYSRSETGCPRLSPKSDPIILNACLTEASKDAIVLTLTPVCSGNTCPQIQSVTGVQMCDPIFPVIFDDS